MIEEALSQVSLTFRAALVLREIEELSYEEIAEILEISLGTVKSRILRGREALRRSLATRLNASPATGYSHRINWELDLGMKRDIKPADSWLAPYRNGPYRNESNLRVWI